MTVWIVDNRVTKRGVKASMTQKLIEVLHAIAPTDVQVVTTANEARRIRDGVVVLSGSSLSIADGDMQRAHAAITAVSIALEKKMPILGICFGFQLLAFMHGMRVEKLSETRKGEDHVEGYGTVYFNHQDAVRVSDDRVLLEKVFAQRVRGVQFHPEATEDGKSWLRQWVWDCHCRSHANGGSS